MRDVRVLQRVHVRINAQEGLSVRIIDCDAGVDQAVERVVLTTVLVHTGHAIEECMVVSSIERKAVSSGFGWVIWSK